MLLQFVDECCLGLVLLSLIVGAFAGYAYRVNRNLPDNDPKKKEFLLEAVFLSPFTWTIYFILWILLLLLRMFLYGIFLILFSVALVVIRKPFILIWLERIALSVGTRLLQANTWLLQFLFGKDKNSRAA